MVMIAFLDLSSIENDVSQQSSVSQAGGLEERGLQSCGGYILPLASYPGSFS